VIIFDLVCDQEHRFEGWFASAAEYDRQAKDKLVQCPLCGSDNTRRVASAAHVHTSVGRPGGGGPEADGQEAGHEPHGAAKLSSRALAKIVQYIVENTEDVGREFPEEARRIHYREIPTRQIRGTASPDEVAELTEEGLEVIALPFRLPERDKIH
jgi:hypothetical protein